MGFNGAGVGGLQASTADNVNSLFKDNEPSAAIAKTSTMVDGGTADPSKARQRNFPLGLTAMSTSVSPAWPTPNGEFGTSLSEPSAAMLNTPTAFSPAEFVVVWKSWVPARLIASERFPWPRGWTGAAAIGVSAPVVVLTV